MPKILSVFVRTLVILSLALTAIAQSPIETQRSTPIGAGDLAPDFTLEDQNKNKVALADARQKSPVVLVFYRGYW